MDGRSNMYNDSLEGQEGEKKELVRVSGVVEKLNRLGKSILPC